MDASEKPAETGGITTSCGTKIIFRAAVHLDDVVTVFPRDIIVTGKLKDAQAQLSSNAK